VMKDRTGLALARADSETKHWPEAAVLRKGSCACCFLFRATAPDTTVTGNGLY